MSDARVLVVGDATLDVIVRPGQPLRPGGDVPASISLSPGGQGANVAVRLVRRGTPTRLITAFGGDPAGRLLRRALEGEGLEMSTLDAAATGTVMSLVDADGERSMASDRAALDAARVVSETSAEWLHCSGYPLVDGRFGDALAAALGARAETTRLSVGGGSLAPQPGPAASFAARLRQSRPDLLLLGLDEAAALAGAASPAPGPAAAAVAARLPGILVLVTAGAAGSAAEGLGLSAIQPTSRPGAPVVDATGAGDAYAAALITGLLDVAWPPSAVDLQAAMAAASELGALVAGVVGAQARVAGEREQLP